MIMIMMIMIMIIRICGECLGARGERHDGGGEGPYYYTIP